MPDHDHPEARALLSAGQTAAAESLLRRELQTDPEDAGAWLLIARCHLASERYEGALSAVDRAMELGGLSTVAHILRAQILLELAAGDAAAERSQRLTAARIELEMALENSPGNLEALKAIARAHLMRADFRALALATEEALAVDPADVDAAHWRVIALMSLSRPADAAVVLDNLEPEVAAHPRMDNLRTWVDAHRSRFGAWRPTCERMWWLLLATPVLLLVVLERAKEFAGPAVGLQLELRAWIVAGCLAALSLGASLVRNESWFRKQALRQAQPFSARRYRQAERRQRELLASAMSYALLLGAASLVAWQGMWLTAFAVGLTGVALVQAWSIPAGLWSYLGRGVALAATALASAVVAVIPGDTPHHGASCVILLMALVGLVLALKRPARGRGALICLALAAVVLDVAAVMQAVDGHFRDTLDAFVGTMFVFLVIALVDAATRFREATQRTRLSLEEEWRPDAPLPVA